MSGRNPKIQAYLKGYTSFSKAFWASPEYPERADESVLTKIYPDFGKGYDFDSLLGRTQRTERSLTIYVPSPHQPPKTNLQPSLLETWLDSWAPKSLLKPKLPSRRDQWIEEWTVKFNPRESVDRNRSRPERPSSRDK